MGWREAWRLGDVAFGELAFQAVYAFRQGNLLPTTSARSLVPKARARVVQSKAIVAIVLSLIAFGVAELLRAGSPLAAALFPSDTSPAILDTGLLTGLLTLDAAFLWWTGLQVLPTLLASAVLPVLEPLPIDRTTYHRAAAFVYLRLFDAPVAAVLVVTPVALDLALGPAAALALVPGLVAAVAFSMALSLLTGRFFVRRIQGSHGGGGGSAVRWALLFLWLVPSFTILGFVTAGGQFLKALADVSGGGSAAVRALLFGAYPVPFALLTGIVAHGTAGTGVTPGTAAVVGAAVVGYAALAGWSVVWLFREVGELAHLPFAPPTAPPVGALALRPQRAPWAVLTKDLRIASRTPGYAFLLLLPILDALALGLITVADAPRASAAVGLALGAVTAAALLATFFGPAFFSIEVMAQSYARTLPLADRAIVLGKATLIAGVYLASSAVVLALASVRVDAPLLFGAFVAAELPAVAAAALVELGWLFRRARRAGFPIANLYSGGWIAFLIAVPGLLLAGAPLVAFRLVGLPAMALLAVGELAVVGPLVLGGGSA